MQRFVNLYKRSWPAIILLLAVSWLLAPAVNQAVAGQLSVISHYEAVGEPWAWLFRLCDIVSALLLLVAVGWRRLWRFDRVLTNALAIICILAAVDSIFPSGWNTFSTAVHDIESLVSVFALGFAAAWDGWRQRSRISGAFFVLQFIAGFLVVSHLVPHQGLMIVQYVYQPAVELWLVWIVARPYHEGSITRSRTPIAMQIVLGLLAGLVFYYSLFQPQLNLALLYIVAFTLLWANREVLHAPDWQLLVRRPRQVVAGAAAVALLMMVSALTVSTDRLQDIRATISHASPAHTIGVVHRQARLPLHRGDAIKLAVDVGVIITTGGVAWVLLRPERLVLSRFDSSDDADRQ